MLAVDYAFVAMISRERIISKKFQHIFVLILVAGYLLNGAFGPSSVLSKHYLQQGQPTITASEGPSHTVAFTGWAARKHIVPVKKDRRLDPDIIFVSPKVWGVTHYHSHQEGDISLQPTSLPHYAPKPRDPPFA